MLVAYEDGRFYEHDGVDVRALIRAGAQWLMGGHVVSGGSTLSMQVTRLIEPRSERTLAAKARQIARARDRA
jgi:penicillin-binding protein 1C